MVILDNVQPNRRPLGQFQVATRDLVNDNPLTPFVQQLLAGDPDMGFAVYERQSDPAGEGVRDMYTFRQEQISSKLQEAGVPVENIERFHEDHGKSGTLSARVRESLCKMLDGVRRRRIRVVAAMHTSRLFRDSSMIEPNKFIGLCAHYGVLVLTSHQTRWHLLDFNNDGDARLFRIWCQQAADELVDTLDKTGGSREESVGKGNYGSSPVPIGYQVRPGMPAHMTGGKATRPVIRIYKPHALRKLEIMRESLNPKIGNWSQLHRHLQRNNLVIPPYDESIVGFAFSRSCIHYAKVGPPEARRKVGIREAFVPSEKMLINILTSPMPFGVRLYGSGPTVRAELKKKQQLCAEEEKAFKTMMRDYFEYVGNFGNLRMFRGGIVDTDASEELDDVAADETWKEDEALFWEVCDKWAKYDMRSAFACNFTHMEKPNVQRSAALPTGRPRTGQQRNPWAEKVFCLKHGLQDGHPIRTFSFHRVYGGHNKQFVTWICARSNSMDTSLPICSAWGDNGLLGKVLDTHFRRTLEDALMGDSTMFRVMQENMDAKKQYVADLQNDLDREKLALEMLNMRAALLQKTLTKENKDIIFQQTSNLYQEEITPKLQIIASLEAEFDAARLDMPSEDIANTEAEVRAYVTRSLANWDNITVDDKADMIRLLVEWVGVLVGDGMTAREGLIVVKWARSAKMDYLVSWRGANKDERAWTPEEDVALRDIWMDDSKDWFAIAARLQPHRKYLAVKERAGELGLVRKGGRGTPARKMQWQTATRQWQDEHSEVLYLHLESSPDASEMCRALDMNGMLINEISLPEQVRLGLAVLRSPLACQNP